MTYEEFLEKLIEIGVYWEEPLLNKSRWYRDRDKKEERGPAQIQSKWCTGGIGGGSCWDDGTRDNHYAMNGESEPEFTDLDNILAEFCPKITFLEYKQLCGKLVVQDSESEYEYYGNSTTYGTKTVKCRELFEYLVQKELI
jgi:hypothetical protein